MNWFQGRGLSDQSMSTKCEYPRKTHRKWRAWDGLSARQQQYLVNSVPTTTITAKPSQMHWTVVSVDILSVSWFFGERRLSDCVFAVSTDLTVGSVIEMPSRTPKTNYYSQGKELSVTIFSLSHIHILFVYPRLNHFEGQDLQIAACITRSVAQKQHTKPAIKIMYQIFF